MKRLLAHLLAPALGLLVFAGAQAQAGFVGWDYSWTPSSLVVPADSGGTGGVSLTFMALDHADGPSDVIATNIRTFSSAPRTTPDTVTNGSYSLTLNLVDSASGEAGSVTFTGLLNGAFSTTSSNLTNTFTGPTSEQLTLGGHLYTITIGPYAPPGPPGAANAGTISAHVDVEDGGGGSGDTPEPSTLVLSGLGLSFLGVASWRKRRQHAAV